VNILNRYLPLDIQRSMMWSFSSRISIKEDGHVKPARFCGRSALRFVQGYRKAIERVPRG
jgi:hypothetical protein